MDAEGYIHKKYWRTKRMSPQTHKTNHSLKN
jgi:hypothetical protein